MSTTLANFLFETVNFLLLAAVLGWVLFKPVRRALDAERSARDAEAAAIDARLAEATAKAEEARAAREAFENELAERREKTLAAARDEAAAIVSKAREARRSEREALRRELAASRAAGAEAAADTAGRLVAGALRGLLDEIAGPALDRALVAAACDELEALPAGARAEAQVESARPLDAESRRLLAAALGAEISERVVDELGAGVRVTTPAGQVDATAIAVARRAAREVARG